MAVNTQIQRVQNNLHKAQSGLASQIALEVQPVSYVLKKRKRATIQVHSEGGHDKRTSPQSARSSLLAEAPFPLYSLS